MYRGLSCVAGALSSCRAGLGGFRLKRVVDVNIAISLIDFKGSKRIAVRRCLVAS
jgi:hypothetical protein